MSRVNISTGAKWEDIVGYSRAVKSGNIIEVSGTVSIKDGKTIGINDYYVQTRRILEIIEETLQQAGATLNDVVRTRIYVIDINNWAEVGRAHREFFGEIKPATSMVGIKGLISPEFLVEIEASAVVDY